MTNLTIRDLDELLLASLRERASRHGLSPEEEAKAILAEALQSADPWAFVDALRARIASSGRPQTDSAVLLREDRDR